MNISKTEIRAKTTHERGKSCHFPSLEAHTNILHYIQLHAASAANAQIMQKH